MTTVRHFSSCWALPARPALARIRSCQMVGQYLRCLSTISPSTALVRLREHYYSGIQDDVMIMTYEHIYKRKNPSPRRSSKLVLPIPPPKTHKTIPEIAKINVHCMMKDSVQNKYHLLSAFMALQCITGERPEVVFAKKSVHNWKLRQGILVYILGVHFILLYDRISKP
jgi:hypothetical protein